MYPLGKWPFAPSVRDSTPSDGAVTNCCFTFSVHPVRLPAFLCGIGYSARILPTNRTTLHLKESPAVSMSFLPCHVTRLRILQRDPPPSGFTRVCHTSNPGTTPTTTVQPDFDPTPTARPDPNPTPTTRLNSDPTPAAQLDFDSTPTQPRSSPQLNLNLNLKPNLNTRMLKC